LGPHCPDLGIVADTNERLSLVARTLGDLGIFTGVDQLENFANLKNLIPVAEMKSSVPVIEWEVGERVELPSEYVMKGARHSVADLLDRTSTSAILVIRDGKIRSENYWHTGGRDVQWISMSVAKSFVSALVGLLLQEGRIRSVTDAINDYIDVPAGSAYDGVSIRDILLMSSGARWSEDYSDPKSDARMLQYAMSGEIGDLDDFVRSMHREREPGTVCRYNSGDTQVLGLLIRKASGMSVSHYMQTRLMEPLGFEQPGYWLTDMAGNEAVFAGLNLVARDFARLGQLYCDGGVFNGQQVINAEWVRDSVHVTAPQCAEYAEPGMAPVGYGYQWWIPKEPAGSFTGIGVYNQFVFVEPKSRTVVVKLSANRVYGMSPTNEGNLEEENLALLNTIVGLDF
jgi:CubicO group peptidase (beta-lactamase class C family)